MKLKIPNYDVPLLAADNAAATAGGAWIAALTIPLLVDGIWKKWSINPAANTKCANRMVPIKMTDLVEFCRAGLNMIMRTIPVESAAPNTSIHCNIEIWMSQRTDTGI